MLNTLHLTLFLLAAAVCQLPPAYCLRHALYALRGERGVAIIEALVAGVVLAIAAIGLAVLFSWGQSFVVAQGDNRVALYLAQQRIESLRASGYGAAEVLKSNCGGTSPAPDETLTAGMGNSQSFTRQTAVEYVNDDDFTDLKCGTDSIRITVTVTPNMLQGEPVTLQTVLTTFEKPMNPLAKRIRRAISSIIKVACLWR